MSSFQSISNFLNAFNGGTRPNRFKISGTNPGGDLFFGHGGRGYWRVSVEFGGYYD